MSHRDRTVTAFGREWSHRQFYGLVRRLVDDGVRIHMQASAGLHEVMLTYTGTWFGQGQTPFLALCEAVEKMEGRNSETPNSSAWENQKWKK